MPREAWPCQIGAGLDRAVGRLRPTPGAHPRDALATSRSAVDVGLSAFSKRTPTPPQRPQAGSCTRTTRAAMPQRPVGRARARAGTACRRAAAPASRGRRRRADVDQSRSTSEPCPPVGSTREAGGGCARGRARVELAVAVAAQRARDVPVRDGLAEVVERAESRARRDPAAWGRARRHQDPAPLGRACRPPPRGARCRRRPGARRRTARRRVAARAQLVARLGEAPAVCTPRSARPAARAASRA